MRTIDGIRYISAREYAEMMNLTPGRVSQLKNELPFVKIEEFGIEVINFDLIALNESEKALQQAKFETTTPIHALSYKDLGGYFSKLLLDLVQFKGNADVRIEEITSKLTLVGTQKNEVDSKLNEALSVIEHLKSANQNLSGSLQEKASKINELENELLQRTTLLDQTEVLRADGVVALENLQIIHSQTKHDVEIKIVENKGLQSENEAIRATLASQVKVVADLSSELEQKGSLIEILGKEKGDLISELEKERLSHQQAKHEMEIKTLENKGLVAEHTNLSKQLRELEAKMKSDTALRLEFDEFKKIVLKMNEGKVVGGKAVIEGIKK